MFIPSLDWGGRPLLLLAGGVEGFSYAMLKRLLAICLVNCL